MSRPRRLTPGLALGLGLGAAVFLGHGVASADTDPETHSAATKPEQHTISKARRAAAAGSASAGGPATRVGPAVSARRSAIPAVSASAIPAVSVDVPPLPVRKALAFTESQQAITDAATAYVAAGGDPADSPRFFFGDLATGSLDLLASAKLSREQQRVQMGNLAVSGYFGGIWLRDNLRPAQPTEPAPAGGAATPRPGGIVAALGMRMFGGLVSTLTALSGAPWLARPVAHASVPVLLALYGYNKGYLEYILDNPPAGVPSMRDTLTCKGFLDCNSSLVQLDIANRYDGALVDLAHPPTLRWAEMKAWSSLLELTTGAGKFVWKIIGAGGLSPTSYASLVDLSSAFLMISKAATLASMQSYGDRDAALASSALLLQAGLWMWSGSYFSGLASNAPKGTIPTMTVS